jgi:hypothetical protein
MPSKSRSSPTQDRFVCCSELGGVIRSIKLATCAGPAFLVVLLFSAASQKSAAQVQFSGPTNYPVGTTPVAVAVGDFNGDGKQDVAVANSGSGNVSILLGNGDGTFQPAVNYNVASAAFLAIGDLNGDHKLDLVIANGSANSVSILLGNGDGTFQNPVPYTVGNAASFVTVGDFNGDGKPDLLVSAATVGSSPAVLSVLIGNGDGTFQSAVHTAVAACQGCAINPIVALGDFNGDGHLDVAMAEASISVEVLQGFLIVLLGRGDGTFADPEYFNLSYVWEVNSIASGDFNGDGKADLAIASFTGIDIMLGNGDGTFTFAPNLGNPQGYYGGDERALAIADFTHTGKLDLATIAYDFSLPGTVLEWFFGKGDGSFQGPGPTPKPCTQSTDCIAVAANSLAVGNFNGDALPDPVIASSSANSVGIFLNAPSGMVLSLSFAGTGGRIGYESAHSHELHKFLRGDFSSGNCCYVDGDSELKLEFRRLGRGMLRCGHLQAACGGNSSSNGGIIQGPTNYTETVSGTSGAIQHSAQLALTVQ